MYDLDRRNVLEFHGISKQYDNGVHALNGLTMGIPLGSIFGFIGLNGAGKTSAIRILAGLSAKDSGEIFFRGQELNEYDSTYKRNIGFVLDEPLFFEWMMVQEYLEFVATMYDLSSNDIAIRTAELLEFFDLDEKRKEQIKHLSTGMKKKVSLAAAIIHKPALIVLDEPLEGIDALAASSIKGTLSIMASNGATILITSHVLDSMERFCTDLGIIDHGKIVLQCKMSEISKVRMELTNNKPLQSLEELFVELVSDKTKRKRLSWL